ncbi:MAG: FAD-binding protein [Polyangiaceae bacterium]
MPKPHVRIESNAKWTNKHQNVSGPVASYYDVWNRWDDQSKDEIPWRPGIAGLQRAIRDAQAASASVRAIGGSWSLSSAAYCPQFMVNTKPLNAFNIGLRAESLLSNAVPFRGKLMFAQCGCTVQDVHDALATENLALTTSGASDGQTLGGAIATGTHGAANQIGAMHDAVLGMHVLAENGEPYWIERASLPVVSDEFLSFIDTPVGNLRRNDDLFDAALVSIGSFGLVHAYLLEVEPIYTLETYLRRFDFQDIRHTLGTLDVTPLNLPRGSALPFHFEITLNPYRTGPGERGAYVRFMYKDPGSSPSPAPAGSDGHRPGDDLLGVIGTLSDIVPIAIPTLVSALMEKNLPASEAVRATPGYTFGPTTIRGRGTSTEMGFRLSDIVAAIDIIMSVADDHPFGGVVAVRYVKGSRALLAFTQYEPTCTVEIQAVDSDRTAEAYRRIWSQLDAAGIAFTFHWGQALPFEPSRYRNVYGSRADRWLAAKGSFLSAAGRRLFSNELVRGVGLE